MTLTREEITARRNSSRPIQRVIFSVKSLYGLSLQSVRMPLNETEAIESGQVCVTLDPDVDPSSNVGIIDYDQGTLKVRYGVQAVFPGLYQLITQGKYDPSLLNPVRAIATDECTLTPDLSGWRALGCLEFLPGSIWAGAEGGWDGRITSSLEVSLAVLKQGRPVQVQYSTSFLINWPEVLGGGSVNIDLEGTMVLVPLLAT